MFQSITAKKTRSADLVLIGRTFFAFALMGFGLAHFIVGEFVSGRAPAWPSSVQGQQIWAYVSGLVMGAAGVLTILNKKKGSRFSSCSWRYDFHLGLAAAYSSAGS
jgi:hypothetical protein